MTGWSRLHEKKPKFKGYNELICMWWVWFTSVYLLQMALTGTTHCVVLKIYEREKVECISAYVWVKMLVFVGFGVVLYYNDDYIPGSLSPLPWSLVKRIASVVKCAIEILLLLYFKIFEKFCKNITLVVFPPFFFSLSLSLIHPHCHLNFKHSYPTLALHWKTCLQPLCWCR